MTISKGKRRLLIAVGVLVSVLVLWRVGLAVRSWYGHRTEAPRIAAHIAAADYDLKQAIAAIETEGGTVDATRWVWLSDPDSMGPRDPVVWSRVPVFGRHWVILKDGTVHKVSRGRLRSLRLESLRPPTE